ncbi:MAG: hypothetical protein GX787_11170 [Tissierellia bacterium]|nr:hypothetical protein [Tissierellia bacterium]
MNKNIKFTAMVLLMVIIFMRYLNYEVPSILIYTIVLLGGVYLISLLNTWKKYK